MVKRLIELLQMNRYRMLYYFYKKRKVRNYPGMKSKIGKAFGYISDGHFYADWDYLLGEGLLIERNEYIEITKKGRREFFIFSNIEMARIIFAIMGMIFIYLWVLSTLGIQVPTFTFILYGLVMFASSALFHLTLRNFAPELTKVDEL